MGVGPFLEVAAGPAVAVGLAGVPVGSEVGVAGAGVVPAGYTRGLAWWSAGGFGMMR
jgi:hypothetical protein